VIDTHAHLELCEGTPEELVAAAAAAGVGRILTVGREQALGLAERFATVWAIVGIHPHEAAEAGDPGALRPLLAHPRVFAAQIELANELELPLVIHTRAADDDTFRMLETARVPVVLHCFSSVDRLDEALARGYLCSFAGNVAYPSAGALREAAARVPDDRILAETDCPYLAPPPHRGRPNQPAYAALTLAVLARERGVEPAALAAQIDRNADRIFGL
jgi:TatD DNase family protein